MSDYLNALPQGYRLDKYEFVEVLGRPGGFGVTYLCVDRELERPVALKEYLPNELAVRDGTTVLPKSSADLDDFEWGRERFLDEARVLARFRHPNIVHVGRHFEAHGTAYIEMEYIEGQTLEEILSTRGPLQDYEVRGIFTLILNALEVIHAEDFLHRDLKPGNIIIRPDGSPVLIDFGAARQATASKSKPLTAIVTAGFAPYEQYSSHGNQGPWTDIYALGAIGYHALTGELPIEASARVRNDPHVPLAQRSDNRWDPNLVAALDAAMNVFEDQRPQSIAEMKSILNGGSVGPIGGPDGPTKGPDGPIGGSGGQTGGAAGQTGALGNSGQQPDRLPVVLAVLLAAIPLGIFMFTYDWGKGDPDVDYQDLFGQQTDGGDYADRGASPTPRPDPVPEPEPEPVDGETLYQQANDLYAAGDYAAAFEKYRAAYDAGVKRAAYDVGWAYQVGEGIPQNSYSARTWYELGVTFNCMNCKSAMGMLHWDGSHGATEDKALSIKYLLEAADQGSDTATRKLEEYGPILYEDADGLYSQKNYSGALEFYKLAYMAGVVNAANDVGWAYSNGEGTSKNDYTALDWYRKGADQECAKCQLNVGVYYWDGRAGLPVDQELSIEWLNRAAANGNSTAVTKLENFGNQIFDEAEELSDSGSKSSAFDKYRLAFDAGIEKAAYNIAVMYETGSGVTQSDSSALYWFTTGVDEGCIPCMNNLGVAYWDGKIGAPQDQDRGLELMRRAARNGYKQAQDNLENLGYSW